MSPGQASKVLVVYYSFTQDTGQVASTMAETLREQDLGMTEAAIGFPDPRYGKRFSKLPMDWPISKIVDMLAAASPQDRRNRNPAQGRLWQLRPRRRS